MSKARAKGTKWETELLERLRGLFGPNVHRAPLRGTQDAGDFVGVPWLHEAKSTKAPHFLEWARTCAKKAPNGAWAVLWHGDRRTDPTELVVLPYPLYHDLVRGFEYRDLLTPIEEPVAGLNLLGREPGI